MAAFEGFAPGTKMLPVPSPLLGSLLAEIDDLGELKCTLRFLWHAAQVNGSPKAVPATTLEADDVLVGALGSAEAVRDALAKAAERGTLLLANGRYLLRTPENERAAERASGGERPPPATAAPRPKRANVYTLYEANIGLLTPMVADHLRDAETTYPPEWIEDAIREAAERNVRNWRYVAAILERWTTEGRGSRERQGPTGKGNGTGKHGEPGRHPETSSAAEYVRQRRAAG
jgi:DnaD/phage-associated family protein